MKSKMELKDRVAELCSREIGEWKNLNQARTKIQIALSTIKGNVEALKREEATLGQEIETGIDQEQPVTALAEKLNSRKVEREGYERRGQALTSELKELMKDESTICNRLHASLHRALFTILPETEARMTEIIDQAVDEGNAWEKDIQNVFADYGLEFDRKDEKKLVKGMWSLGDAIQEISSFYRPDLDGIGFQAFRRFGRQAST